MNGPCILTSAVRRILGFKRAFTSGLGGGGWDTGGGMVSGKTVNTGKPLGSIVVSKGVDVSCPGDGADIGNESGAKDDK